MIAWLDWQDSFALVAIIGTMASAWLHERREARAEERRDDDVDKLDRLVKGFLSQVAELEARVRQLEAK